MVNKKHLNELKKEVRSRYLQLYIVAIVILLITWFVWTESPKTFRIITLLFFVGSQFLYNVKLLKDDFLNKFLIWIYSFVLLLFAITYLAASVNEITIAIISLLIAPFILLIGLSISQLTGLWKSKTIFQIIIYYFISVVLIILLFGYIYAFQGVIESNSIKWVSDNTSVTDIWDLIYFSAQTFYSNSFGEMVPLGQSRLFSIVELVISSIIHIIVLGMIISRISEKNKYNK